MTLVLFFYMFAANCFAMFCYVNVGACGLFRVFWVEFTLACSLRFVVGSIDVTPSLGGGRCGPRFVAVRGRSWCP